MEIGPEPRSKLWEEAYIHTNVHVTHEYAVSITGKKKIGLF